MNDSLDELASEYVLGTLPAEQRAEVQQRLAHDAALRAAVDAWEQRLLPLVALAQPVPPSAQLWRRIERRIKIAETGVAWWNLLAFWRGLSAVGLMASVVLAALLLTRPPMTAPSFVVVLMAPQSQAPGWVVQASDNRQIQLIPLGVMRFPQTKPWSSGPRPMAGRVPYPWAWSSLGRPCRCPWTSCRRWRRTSCLN